MTGEPLPFPREPAEPAPGAVHLPDWLDAAEQRALVEACREWSRPPAGMRTVLMPTGGQMSVRTVCLGWHWYPYGYARTVVDGDGAPVKPFPPELGDLARRALAAAYGTDGLADVPGAARYEPDIAVVNHYPHGAKMGLHKDKEERVDAPVVSLSLGDSCVFRLGNTETRTRPWTDLELRSGDLFVFGGPARFAYHGVVKTLPGTADPALGLVGRLNITVRQSGLA
ncbi:alpha-ketoglutarate-dependent dioxygenase AlkB family protein [Kitasatospora sp. DSM 101779]|uniref:alpha-ketoglutarate-dependent dioxygenase AlkB family protein n=1 Tax=Kitasatospora sp. DSM 101779 TaxID=2853165 RepID=UPI0021DB1873|nr:alpha-ketoglutarate-dependent dioxygenase AlkB [Kitasatospora sp. DSM 101779]MCU7822215.1 alpha-ketoglutarate-dependent dioxygenase AlkB [Kitasatospora sp. DSM 101779]